MSFAAFTKLPYKDQGAAFLNAYWAEHSDIAEKVWSFVERFVELDQKNGKEGNDLDEFSAHRFLEKVGETKTVKQLRQELKESDLDFNKRLALIEYLLYSNKKTIADFVKRPQGGGTEIVRCQQMVAEAQKAVQASVEAVKELKAQEDAYNQKTAELKKKTEVGGLVAKNRAKAELAQHLSEDPLPLRKAKITAEAAQKKAERAFEAAQQALEEAKKSSEAGKGTLWFVERELTEAKKYMPLHKGGIARK